MSKSLPMLGCCGIACGLCPRFYTDGASKCPGCGGQNFAQKHPSCSVKTCCADHKGLEVCALCADFPCGKYADREKIERDSFVTHRRIFANHAAIRADGLPAFADGLETRVRLLETLRARFDDGRSGSFYCLAAALLSEAALSSALEEAGAVYGDSREKARALRAILSRRASEEDVALKLIR